MKKDRIIFHIDMNCFFASCHQAVDQSLLNQPIAVGHNVKRGIIVTSSYEARECGVKTGMPIHCAKQKCPGLKIINPVFELYVKMATKLFEYLTANYTKMIEIASIDECYLDVTELYHNYSSVLAMAQHMQQGVYRDLRLPNSIGISTNKFLAKMASDMKKPMGITKLLAADVPTKLWPLPIGDMYGVGKSMQNRLFECGIKTIGDLANYKNREFLCNDFGKTMEHLLANAIGVGDDVINLEHNQLKSINNEITLNDNIDDYEELKEWILSLARNIAFRAKRRMLKGMTVGIVIKYNYVSRTSSQHQLASYTDDVDVIYSRLLMLFDQLWNGKPIRLIGAFLGKIAYKYSLVEQLDLFKTDDTAQSTLTHRLIKEINAHHQEDILFTGTQIVERSYLKHSQTKYVESDRIKPHDPVRHKLSDGN